MPTGTSAEPGTDPVLILGGGLIGLALAHELARQGLAATVLSRRRSEAAGFVAAGMLAPHAEGLDGSLLELGQRSLERIPAWVARIESDSGLACGLRICGIVVPFASAAEREAYPTAAQGERLDRSGLEREIPGIGPLWQAGLLFPQDGQIDNRRRLMRALERACVHRGVRFEEGCEVLGLVMEPQGQQTGEAPGEQLAAVRLRRADGQELTLPCREAVLCGGAWSAQLLPGLPVFPVKGQMLSLQGPIGALSRVVFGPGTYLVPREDGLLVVGATSEPEAGFGEGLTPAGQRQLQAGGASAPVRRIRHRCWGKGRSGDCGWPPATTATVCCWRQSAPSWWRARCLASKATMGCWRPSTGAASPEPHGSALSPFARREPLIPTAWAQHLHDLSTAS
jgi:glycine oxidase